MSPTPVCSASFPRPAMHSVLPDKPTRHRGLDPNPPQGAFIRPGGAGRFIPAVGTSTLAGTIQLDRSCLLDLLLQIPRRSLVTGRKLARASLAPRLAEASASQSLPPQLNRSCLANRSRNTATLRPSLTHRDHRASRSPRARKTSSWSRCARPMGWPCNLCALLLRRPPSARRLPACTLAADDVHPNLETARRPWVHKRHGRSPST